MAFQIDQHFDWFLEQFGAPQTSTPATSQTLKKYQSLLPARLLEYWQQYGFCAFKDGLFWIVNPDDFRDVMNTWLKGTGILQTDNFHVIARSGFGELYLWGEKTGQSWNIEPINGVLFSNGSNEKDITSGKANDRLETFFGIISPDTMDLEDVDTDEAIFEVAVERFGPLEENEMFTFEPAPFLGGEQSLKSLAKVDLFIQNEVLAGMGQKRIQDIRGLVKEAFGNN